MHCRSSTAHCPLPTTTVQQGTHSAVWCRAPSRVHHTEGTGGAARHAGCSGQMRPCVTARRRRQGSVGQVRECTGPAMPQHTYTQRAHNTHSPARLPVPVGRHPGLCLSVTAPSAQHNATQHNTTQHNTTQHNTTQHNTTQRNATQHNPTQHNTTQRNATQRNATQRNSTQHTTPHHTTPHHTTPHHTTPHHTTPHHTTPQHSTTQHSTTQHNTTQHNTTQHNTTQHNTTQHNTTQHNTTQHNTTQQAPTGKRYCVFSSHGYSWVHTRVWGRVCSRGPLLGLWVPCWGCGPANLLPSSLVLLGHCNMSLCHLLLLVFCALLHVHAHNDGLRIPEKGRTAVPTGAPEPPKAAAPAPAAKEGPVPAVAQPLGSTPLQASGEPIPADVPEEEPKTGAPPGPLKVVCPSPPPSYRKDPTSPQPASPVHATCCPPPKPSQTPPGDSQRG